jgi:hypothetical protein
MLSFDMSSDDILNCREARVKQKMRVGWAPRPTGRFEEISQTANSINSDFDSGWLRVNRKDAADGTVMAGCVFEIARYVQR